MDLNPVKRWGLLPVILIMLALVGCREPASTSIDSAVSKSNAATSTPTPTITQTRTPANTITPQPSRTPTITTTPYRTLSPTGTPTLAPLDPAVLFHYKDINGKLVDWSYFHVTEIGYGMQGEINDLWAFMAFQLLDRAVHQRSFTFLDETITVYYLNVAHEFKGEILQMQLVIGGTPGANIQIQNIPADGSAYIQVQVRDSTEDFAPYVTHRDANRDYEYRDSAYPLMFLAELQTLLASLPDEVILLADHPILFPHNDWAQIKLDMSRVSYLAARYQPFFKFDEYDRLVEQSDFAYALRDYLMEGKAMPAGIYAFSSQTLIIIKNE
jgi:hypothetical protein